MLNIFTKPAKLLLCMVGRHRGELLVAAAKAAGARGGTLALGRTIDDNRILQALSLADVHQDIVFILLMDEKAAVLEAVREAAANNPKKLGGLALLLDVSGMLIRGAGQETTQPTPSHGTENTAMESGYELITVIVNTGFADDVMAVARKAGATGGTILNARGTGTEEDVKFFGISLVPEKEMLFIVSAREKAQDILNAVNSVPKLCAPGGGVVFNMNVEEFHILGK
ncbi:P-II family nitrogen regulator [Desulfovibrio sp. OttesenSCG-928-A18]|nr:P-II family nitrogen regulator [Desulfovibrio sp. OttesenSCG-928-A18]